MREKGIEVESKKQKDVCERERRRRERWRDTRKSKMAKEKGKIDCAPQTSSDFTSEVNSKEKPDCSTVSGTTHLNSHSVHPFSTGGPPQGFSTL